MHVHPRDASGRETLAVDDAVRALRAVDVEVSVSTGAWISDDRLTEIAAWRELPDLASVNVMETGWRDLADLLVERGVGIEIGLAGEQDARAFLDDPPPVRRRSSRASAVARGGRDDLADHRRRDRAGA